MALIQLIVVDCPELLDVSSYSRWHTIAEGMHKPSQIMKFDPTKNYYGLDVSKEENAVIWNFWEFLKSLIALSDSAEIQRNIIGYGDVTLELADDFDASYSSRKSCYLMHDLLSSSVVVDLDALEKYLEDRSGDRLPEFWDDESLEHHPDWEQVRAMAAKILNKMNYHDLVIDCERTIEESNSISGERLLIESTRTCLKKT